MPSPSKKNQPSAPVIEISTAEQAYRGLESRFQAIPKEKLAVVNVDMQVAAVFALGVSEIVQAPEVRPRFAKLAKALDFDDRHVADLPQIALAAWYARHRFMMMAATRSAVQVPEAIVEEATALRARMLRLLEYWMMDDPAVLAELAAIRQGTGYQDLANDLIALGSLYGRFGETLAQDKKLYQPGDAASAARLAGTILHNLGLAATAEQNEWAAMQPRAWTLLLDTYEEVRRAARFLLGREMGESRFPSLVLASRGSTSRPTKNGEPGKGGEAPAEPEAEQGGAQPVAGAPQ
jgi:hypothetical protein